MQDNKAKVLVLVEGEKTDVKLMRHLFEIYGIDKKHQIVSYNTNIYVLYNKMFRDTDPETVDLLQLLKEQESDSDKKHLFDERYSDILLIFDLDPQDPQYSSDKIREMAEFFVESSDMGKLYLNYPMVEAFYHMRNIPDEKYNSYIATMPELTQKQYKARVQSENRNHDYSKFAVDKAECNIVIKQNIDKAWSITDTDGESTLFPNTTDILKAQLDILEAQTAVAVLCTCVFYIPDYNPNLISE